MFRSARVSEYPSGWVGAFRLPWGWVEASQWLSGKAKRSKSACQSAMVYWSA